MTRRKSNPDPPAELAQAPQTVALPFDTYVVTDVHGTVTEVETTWLFNDDGSLKFRRGQKGRSDLVATWAAGQWTSCILKQKG